MIQENVQYGKPLAQINNIVGINGFNRQVGFSKKWTLNENICYTNCVISKPNCIANIEGYVKLVC